MMGMMINRANGDMDNETANRNTGQRLAMSARWEGIEDDDARCTHRHLQLV
jgi:hypothetical protein